MVRTGTLLRCAWCSIAVLIAAVTHAQNMVHVWNLRHEYVAGMQLDSFTLDSAFTKSLFAAAGDQGNECLLVTAHPLYGPPPKLTVVPVGLQKHLFGENDLPDGEWLVICPDPGARAARFAIRNGAFDGDCEFRIGPLVDHEHYVNGQRHGEQLSLDGNKCTQRSEWDHGQLVLQEDLDTLGRLRSRTTPSSRLEFDTLGNVRFRYPRGGANNGDTEYSGLTIQYYPSGEVERRGERSYDGWANKVLHFAPDGSVDREEYYSLGELYCERLFDRHKGRRGKWGRWRAINPANQGGCELLTKGFD